MAAASRDLTTVDLKGLKPHLARHAEARGTSLSAVIRDFLASACQVTLAHSPDASSQPRRGIRTRVCVRLSTAQAEALATAARTCGLPLGEYIAGLQDGVSAMQGGASVAEHLQVLSASTAELATLSRSLRHLNELVASGAYTAAGEYDAVLASLDDDVRRHLRLAATTISDLLPRMRAGGKPARSKARQGR